MLTVEEAITLALLPARLCDQTKFWRDAFIKGGCTFRLVMLGTEPGHAVICFISWGEKFAGKWSTGTDAVGRRNAVLLMFFGGFRPERRGREMLPAIIPLRFGKMAGIAGIETVGMELGPVRGVETLGNVL